MRHNLHFILNENSYLKLKKMSLKFDESISGTIVEILKKMTPYLEKKQLTFQNKRSQYQYVGDLEEKRRQMHVYLPEDLYRKLKEMHQDMNFFSIGQIMREIIDYFLKESYKTGFDNFIARIQLLILSWGWKKKKFATDKKIFMRESFLHHKINPYIIVTYDCKFHPFSIQFLS
jgi:hypothetical protein